MYVLKLSTSASIIGDVTRGIPHEGFWTGRFKKSNLFVELSETERDIPSEIVNIPVLTDDVSKAKAYKTLGRAKSESENLVKKLQEPVLEGIYEGRRSVYAHTCRYTLYLVDTDTGAFSVQFRENSSTWR